MQFTILLFGATLMGATTAYGQSQWNPTRNVGWNWWTPVCEYEISRLANAPSAGWATYQVQGSGACERWKTVAWQGAGIVADTVTGQVTIDWNSAASDRSVEFRIADVTVDRWTAGDENWPRVIRWVNAWSGEGAVQMPVDWSPPCASWDVTYASWLTCGRVTTSGVPWLRVQSNSRGARWTMSATWPRVVIWQAPR